MRYRDILLVTLWQCICCQTFAQLPSCDGSAMFSYDSLSIHLMKDSDLRGSWRSLPSAGFISVGFPVMTQLATAMKMKSNRFISVPPWVLSDRYAIEARMDDPLSGTASTGVSFDELYRKRLLSVMCSRFSLRVHLERRTSNVYRLVKTSGFHLKQSDAQNSSMAAEATGYVMVGATMEMIGDQLEALSTIPVVNETGQSARYDITLTWRGSSEGDAASRFEAVMRNLEDEAGLRLVPAKLPIDFVVIDSISKPTGN